MVELKRELSSKDLVLLGIGSIIGSGIFILFASILARAKTQTFWVFLLAAIPNILTAMAYAELASMYQSNDLEYECIRDSYNGIIATISTYILLGFIIFNTATVLIFAGHIMNFQDMNFYICLVILFILSFVNYLGISVSKGITNTIGVVEVTLLILIALIALPHWKGKNIAHTPNLFSVQNPSFWVASFLSLFLYSGYDAVVKLSEESVNPAANIPIGVIGSCVAVTIIYLALAATAVSSEGIKEIYSSNSPITQIFKEFVDARYSILVTIIGIVIVLNTFFISLISLSRFCYSLSLDGRLPHLLSDVNPQFQTPHNAVITVFLVIAVVLMLVSGERSAMFANMFFLGFMCLLMSAVIILRFKRPDDKRSFKVPFSIRKVPVLMVIGIVICLFYLYIGSCCFFE